MRGQCVLDVFPVPQFDGPVAEAERHPDHELEDTVTNRVRRYAIYYYYATVVYDAHGKERAHLPVCIVTAVRSKFPNDVAIAYGDEDYHLGR